MSFEHRSEVGDCIFILKDAILDVEDFKPQVKGSSFWIRVPLQQPRQPRGVPRLSWIRINPSCLHNNPLVEDSEVRVRFNPGFIIIPVPSTRITKEYLVISSKSIGVKSHDLTTFTEYERTSPVPEGSLRLVELTLQREDILKDEEEDSSSRTNFYESSSELVVDSSSVESSTVEEPRFRIKVVKWSDHYSTELEGLFPQNVTTLIMDQGNRMVILPYDDYSGRTIHIKNLSSGLIRIRGLIDLIQQTLEIKPKSARTLQFDDRNWYLIGHYDH